MKYILILAMLTGLAIAEQATYQETCTTTCVVMDYNTGQCIRWQTRCW